VEGKNVGHVERQDGRELPLLVDLSHPPAGFVGTVELLGGKGLNLLRLSRAGFAVPRAFCLTTAAYRRVVEPLFARAGSRVQEPAAVAETLLAAGIPAPLGDALVAAYTSLKDGGGLPRLAVRSSATGEDSLEASHAGQAATYLNVAGFAALLDAVRGCWASLWSEAHLLYRHRPHRPTNGLVLHEAPAMAVVIQEMVPARVAGVLFSRNPVTSDPQEMLVSAAWGLGETVVGGGAADTFLLSRQGRLLQRSVAVKESLVEQHPEGGTRVRTLASPQVGQPCLTEEQLERLAALGRAVEQALGGPVDLEWAEVAGRIALLQARPITSLPAARPAAPPARLPARLGRRPSSPAPRPVVWSNVNVGEALPGVATPLTWSIIAGFSRRGFEQAFGALGLSVPPGYQLVGNVAGRIYLNLSEFMSIASGVPFFSPAILASLAGGVDPAVMTGAYEQLSRLRFLRGLPRATTKVLESQLLGPRQAKSHAGLFRAERERFLDLDLGRLSWAELGEELQRLHRLFFVTGELLLTCSSNALASYALLHLLLRAGGEEARKLEGELFTGLAGLESAKPGVLLLELARLARQLGLQEQLQARPVAGDGLQQLAALAAHPAAEPFLRLFSTFLAEHGHRGIREAELAVPRWRDDPSFPLQVVASHLDGGPLADPRERSHRQQRARAEATARVRELLPAPLRPVLSGLLPLAQETARVREGMRSRVTETLGLYRRFFLEVGRRLTGQGRLRQPGDVFLLTVAEVEELLAGGTPSLLLRVIEREARYRADQAAPEPPATFRTTSGTIPASGGEVARPAPVEEAQLQLQGLGCSAGRVEGTVRVLASADEGYALRSGEILVAHTTDVGWTPLFLVAAGVILDKNGPLSHAAIVAREYGLPAVVNTGNATQLLRDGDRVLLDGAEGRVLLLARGAALPSHSSPPVEPAGYRRRSPSRRGGPGAGASSLNPPPLP
jgi:pyruvate,water dikinase